MLNWKILSHVSCHYSGIIFVSVFIANSTNIAALPTAHVSGVSGEKKRQYELFFSVPEGHGDYLIEDGLSVLHVQVFFLTFFCLDYACSLHRPGEILMRGRLYISKNHICFHSNILGWITDVSTLFVASGAFQILFSPSHVSNSVSYTCFSAFKNLLPLASYLR